MFKESSMMIVTIVVNMTSLTTVAYDCKKFIVLLIFAKLITNV
jgi:hypothetical protein